MGDVKWSLLAPRVAAALAQAGASDSGGGGAGDAAAARAGRYARAVATLDALLPPRVDADGGGGVFVAAKIARSAPAKFLVADALLDALLHAADVGDAGAVADSGASSAERLCAALAATGASPHLQHLHAAVLHVAIVHRVRAAAAGSDFTSRLVPDVTAWVGRELLPAAARLLLGDEAVQACAAACAAAVASAPALHDATAPRAGLLHAARLAALRAAAPPAPAGTFTNFPEGQAPWGRSARRRTGDGAARPLPAGVALLAALTDAALRSLHEAASGALTAAAFDIVREWPASAPAVHDLRESLDALGDGARNALSAGLIASLHGRLLHAGAGTSTILDLFVAACRALTSADPTGVVLRPVAAAIRGYLAARPDTARVIVCNLTAAGGADAGSELYAELASRKRGRLGGVAVAGADDGADDDEAPPPPSPLQLPAAPSVEAGTAAPSGGYVDASTDDGMTGSRHRGADAGGGGNFHSELLRFASPAHAAVALSLLAPRRRRGGGRDDGDGNGGSDDVDDDEGDKDEDEEEDEDGGAVGGWLGAAAAPGAAARRGALSAFLPQLLPPAADRSFNLHVSGARPVAPSPRDFGLWVPPPRLPVAADGGDGGGAPGAPAATDDLLAMFVGVVGSPDVFTAEHRSQLAERLLAKARDDFETDADDVCVCVDAHGWWVAKDRR